MTLCERRLPIHGKQGSLSRADIVPGSWKLRISRVRSRTLKVSFEYREEEPRVQRSGNTASSRRGKMAERKDAMNRPRGTFCVASRLVFTVFLCLCCELIGGTAPQIVPMKQLDDLKIGQRVIVLCAIREGSLPISFSWRKDGVPVTHSNEIKILHMDDFQETLQIARVTPEHVGNYTCSAKNSFGSDQASVTVIPKYQPVWVNSNSTSVAVVLGETLTLDCACRGQPQPEVSVTKGKF